MADNPSPPESKDFTIGYRKPPEAHRFSKGQSGNPAGRPKNSRNRSQGERLRSLMLEEAYRPVKAKEEGLEVTISTAQAVVRSLAEAAARGEARAQALFFSLVNTSEIDEAAYEQTLAPEGDAEARRVEIRIVDPPGSGKTRRNE